MSNTASPTSIIFDANTLLGALAASNPDLPDEILHAILRRMIAEAQVEVAQLSTENIPLKARIRLPVSGKPKAKAPPISPLENKGSNLSIGQIGQPPEAYEMLGPKAAAKAIGVSRSTLDNWRRAGLIIALPKGRSSHVIPLVQFVHSRPLSDIDTLLSACSHDAVRAWEALIAPMPVGSLRVIEAAIAGDTRAIPNAALQLT